MTQITQDNFDKEYQDIIEMERIDKFVSDEMDRQMHRYIKAYHGSKDVMDKFIQRLKGMTVEQKEEAIAAYIDLNRKAVSGLDLQMVLVRAMANYCDTFFYFRKMLSDRSKFDFYLKRIREKYIRLHEGFEQDGKFGIRGCKGDILVQPNYDFLRRVFTNVDDGRMIPIIAQKNGKMGLILPDGKETVVADFVYDDISLRDEYDIQIEFGDIGNILAYLSIGDRPQELERLVSALAEIRRRYQTDSSGLLSQEYIDPEVVTSPQEAFYAEKRSLPLHESAGCVCSEFVMCYPPGIPILAPGERITPEILDYIAYAKAKGCSMTGPEDPEIRFINVLR